MGFMGNLIRQWDLYKKVPEDLYVSTYSGVCLSFVGIAIMTLLFALEFSAFLAVKHTTDIQLDHGEGSLGHDGVLTINFNVTFHDLPCAFTSVDLYDITGTKKHDVSSNIIKTRVDHKGRVLGEIERNAIEPEEHASVETRENNELEALLAEELDKDAKSMLLTGSTFDKYIEENGKDSLIMVDFFAPWCIWCRRLEPVWENTAKKLMGTHRAKEKIFLASVDCTKDAELCQKYYVRAYPTIYLFLNGDKKPVEAYHGERTTTALVSRAYRVLRGLQNAADKKKHDLFLEDGGHDAGGASLGGHEGCNVAGRLMVKRVPGNFHMNLHSPRYSHEHELVNASHTVHRLNFGDPISEHRIRTMVSMPDALRDDVASDHLDNQVFISNAKNFTYVHYLKVVSKRYMWEGSNEKDIHMYLYSAFSNEHKEDTVLPSVMFQYDLSPMTVIAKYERQPFYHFITNFCAIIGGVFAIIGIVDRVFQTITAGFNKKIL